MTTTEARSTDRVAQAALSFLKDLLGSYHPRDFAVRLWDGTTWQPEVAAPPSFTLVLNHPGALRRMFLPPSELSLGESYIYEDIDIEGDVEAVFRLADYLLESRVRPGRSLAYGLRLLLMPRGPRRRNGQRPDRLSGERGSVERDRQAIKYHYDTSNEFFSAWLDERMVYSCAYFTTPDEGLDSAQERKLDYICRKLRLREGERLLDIGCGWGGLVIHAAKNYGVKAVGVTASQQQAELARERVHRAGLGQSCRVEFKDYRQVGEDQTFDKLVSVGMFEHVEESGLRQYFGQALRMLRPGGVFLNHGIARRGPKAGGRGQSFVGRYIFPDGDLVPISSALRAAEMAGFEVRDVESLREHYALTLRNWLRRLEEHEDEATRATNRVTFRMWKIFMSAASHYFETGRFNVYQTLLSKPDRGDSRLPLTRADWYA